MTLAMLSSARGWVRENRDRYDKTSILRPVPTMCYPQLHGYVMGLFSATGVSAKGC
jgi:hypothetical protein